MPKEPLQSKLPGHSGIGAGTSQNHTDPDTSKTAATPIRRPTRSTTDTVQKWSRANIEALAGQNITNAAKAATCLEAGSLVPSGGASSINNFVGALLQISMMPGIRANKNCMDAVWAVAFTLAECD